MLYVKLKVKKSDGTAIPAAAAADACIPANLTLASLFSDVTLLLNDVIVEGGHQLYPYKALMSTMLQFDDNAKKTHLELAGWNEDDAKRKAWIKK